MPPPLESGGIQALQTVCLLVMRDKITGEATSPLLLFRGEPLKADWKRLAEELRSAWVCQPQGQEYEPRVLRLDRAILPQAWQVWDE